ncbi:MAG TPA: hypothetical protein VK850_09025 [Candidatus Binatia bacterium]|nr:hypothetical protein [Candidatus Binatia bacterium]
MSKCAGYLPEFDDVDDNDEVERRRIRRPQRSGKRKHPVRTGSRGRSHAGRYS